MSGTLTTRMLAVYEQLAAPLMFMSGFFRSPPANFHTTEAVEIDIIRSEEDVAVAIQDLSNDYRMNSEDLYTNKAFVPPIFKEAIVLNSTELLKRMPGASPFDSPDFRMNVISRMFRGMGKLERKIRRSLELQSSQVLQTGTATLIDANGNAIYSIDYKPKATHFPTAGVIWSNPASTKLSDLESLAEVIRGDGLGSVNTAIFGHSAFESLMQDTAVQARFDTRLITLGTIAPMSPRGNGGIYRGVLEIGNYSLDVWTYPGRYTHPQTGVSTQYLAPGKVILMDSGARLDATFGAIPNIGRLMGATASNLIPELPSRLSLQQGSIDLHLNVWLSANGEQLYGGVGARSLMIPTAIDTFGCLDTGI